MASFLISNAFILTQNERREGFSGSILIKNGIIEEIYKDNKGLPKKLNSSVKKLSAENLVVLPGFIQTHIHLCQTLYRNLADDLELLDWLSKKIWPMEANHTPETLFTSALAGIHELLSSGTTCILDMATVRHTDAIFKAVKQTGIRASVGKCLMDHPDYTPPSLYQKADVAIQEALALHRKWNGTEKDRIRVSFAPRFAFSCTDELLKKVRDHSKKLNALVHTHASENQKEVQTIRSRTKQGNIEFLHALGLTGSNVVLAHCVWPDKNEIDLLSKTKTNVAHCPSSNLKLASGLAPITEFLKKEINVSLGTDGAACNNNLNIFNEMKLAATLHKPGHGPKNIRAQEALDMATINGAIALNWEKDIGSIEPGKKADLIAIDLKQLDNYTPNSAFQKQDTDAIASSIVYSSAPQHIVWTMVDGKILYEKKKVLTISKLALLKEIEKSLKVLLLF